MKVGATICAKSANFRASEGETAIKVAAKRIDHAPDFLGLRISVHNTANIKVKYKLEGLYNAGSVNSSRRHSWLGLEV